MKTEKELNEEWDGICDIYSIDEDFFYIHSDCEEVKDVLGFKYKHNEDYYLMGIQIASEYFRL